MIIAAPTRLQLRVLGEEHDSPDAREDDVQVPDRRFVY